MAAEWQERAKCRDQDPERWVTANLPAGRARAHAAIERCDGCPVWRDCALHVLDMDGFNGMVAAAVAFPDGHNNTDHARKSLRARLGLRPEVVSTHRSRMPECCTTCELTLVPTGTKEIPEGHARYMGKGLCMRCYNASRRRQAVA
ncbi:transcription factor WhiB [Rhodococcus sp. OK611]|uniref:WhiB family transcriptional regulator n=1 Tax=unclassified Rhodococcus (in: high G+C Gram-positive bacteria) TaxID=192944 RepID=UPI000BD94014|nr:MULTISPECIES: WhiB family transcriptional regulator [unclassified Rhodococcus (in: high G+C Gram-positive bacteria)]PTR42064.1 transcription factor WhiB [Rhodococcus sp. OK611]SNX91489.1 Transcription factor WhiB [Rhodococcus sp. OK270]